MKYIILILTKFKVYNIDINVNKTLAIVDINKFWKLLNGMILVII